MAIAVLPRATAGAIITRAVARGIWAVALLLLVLDLPVLFDVFWRRGVQSELATPLVCLVVMICALVATALRPTRWRVLLYLFVGGVCVTVYEIGVLSADPSLLMESSYLVNRPAVAIVLIGSLSSSTYAGMLWCTLGYAVSLAASVLAAQIAGQPWLPGEGPTLLFIVYVTTFLTLALAQRAQRTHLPDFAAAEEWARRMTAEREFRTRTAAVVHDTVLSDLSFIINAPDVLDERSRRRLGGDVETLTGGAWLALSREHAEVHRSEAFVRNRLAAVVSELQWRGLTVHLSGSGSTALSASEEGAAAAVDAAKACLENVLAHSGVTGAQIVVSQGEGESTIMVIDEGVGFDPGAVPSDRLGLKLAVIHRVEAVGGYVRVWSSPGNGTSVLISVPAVKADSLRDETGGDGGALPQER